MEIGSQAWLDRCCERLNASDSFREAASGWTCPLGLTFLDADEQPRHHALVVVRDGACEAADEVDGDEVATAPVRLTAPYPVWQRVLSGDLHLLKAIMLRRVRLDGDLLHIVKNANAAKVLIECVGDVEAEIPTADAS